jgi:hypothetical protein
MNRSDGVPGAQWSSTRTGVDRSGPKPDERLMTLDQAGLCNVHPISFKHPRYSSLVVWTIFPNRTLQKNPEITGDSEQRFLKQCTSLTTLRSKLASENHQALCFAETYGIKPE